MLRRREIPAGGLAIGMWEWKPPQSRQQRKYVEDLIRRAAVSSGASGDNEVLAIREQVYRQCAVVAKEHVKIGGFDVMRRESTADYSREKMSDLIEQVKMVLAEQLNYYED